MNLILLLGAGFSRNWGGPLASEMLGRILGRRQLSEMPELRQVFTGWHTNGGFEAALGNLQAEYARTGSMGALLRLQKAQEAIAEVFAEFDDASSEMAGIEFQDDVRYMLRTFMMRFDAIFTLNLDLLLEHHYPHDNIELGPSSKWTGWQLPGMKQIPVAPGASPDIRTTRWVPLPDDQFEIRPGLQPIFKLHGSTNWFDSQTQQIMVLGYNKTSTIQSQNILKRYHAEFAASLAKPDTRLVVIGYSFGDQHINAAICNRIETGDLRMFVIDPLGIEVTNAYGNGLDHLFNRYEDIIDGYSVRFLRETFGGDISEHMNLMRFIAPS